MEVALDTASNPQMSEVAEYPSRLIRRGAVPLSVVLYGGKRPFPPEALAACRRNAGDCELEFLVTGVSAPDDPADPRNAAVQTAKYDHILFLGSDVQPVGQDLFRIHASWHSTHPEKTFAVLGGLAWPGGAEAAISLSLGRLLGDGERLGDPEPAPFRFLNYQYLSDGNFSLKKSLVQDWLRDGFRPVFSAALGSVELGYRLSQRLPLRIFYDPTARACYRREWSIHEIMEHQVAVGKTLRLLVDQHPQITEDFGLQPYMDSPHGASRSDFPQTHDRAVIEGLKAWTRIASGRLGAGKQPWHDDVQSAILDVCLLQGFVSASPHFESGTAWGLIIERLQRRLRRVLHRRLAARAGQP